MYFFEYGPAFLMILDLIFCPLFKCALAKLTDRTCSFLVDVINILTSNAFGAQKNRQYS